MKQVLLDKTLANVIKIEITRDTGAATATLTIRNDVEISGELRERGRRLAVRTADIPDSAAAFFGIMKAKLADGGFALSNEQLVNLPKMGRGEKNFSASLTIEIGDMSDDQLRRTFDAIFTAAEQRMAAARYGRRAGKWTDRKGGKGATSIGL